MPLFRRKEDKTVDYKARLENKLYLARENPEPIFDLSDCSLKHVPSGIYLLCKVFRKEGLYLQHNHLRSLNGGGNLEDLYYIKEFDVHNNCLPELPAKIEYLLNLRVLNLSNNELKTLPKSIGHLKQLNVLNISNNMMKFLPDELGQLRELVAIDLRGNKQLTHLPTSLCHCTHLSQLFADVETLIYPQPHIYEKGSAAVLQFLSKECGLQYSPSCTSVGARDMTASSQGDKDCLQEQEKPESQQLEQQFEELHVKELLLCDKTKLDKQRLLDKLLQQQSKLDDEVQQVQRAREDKKCHLLRELQEAENVGDETINRLALSDSTGDRREQPCRGDMLDSVEQLLAEEERHEKLVRAYEESRGEMMRQCLKQESERAARPDCGKSSSTDLAERLRRDAALQRTAVAVLLERGDARSLALRQRVELVGCQLADLTSLELRRNRLRASRQVMELCEKRKELSCVLLELMEQRASRHQQLLHELDQMEGQRALQHQSEDADFWLVQYRRLLDCRPAHLAAVERDLHPALGRCLLTAGVVRYLPFLAGWLDDGRQLSDLSDDSLAAMGITQPQDRATVLKALSEYAEGKWVAEERPSAPPLSEGESQCVVCMDRACSVVLVPCGHLCCCADCSGALLDCPLCRSHVERRVRALLP